MQPAQMKTVLAALEGVRKQTRACIVVGITEDQFFFSVDEQLPTREVEILLRQSAPQIRDSVARMRDGKQVK